MGAMAVALMMGGQTKAAVIAYDGFDMSTTVADTNNGIYIANDWGKYPLRDNPNKEVAGGNIVGFTADWSTTSSAFHVLPSGRAISKRTSSTGYLFLSREIVDMSQKTVAYGSVHMSATQASPEADAFGLLGFSNPSMSSANGASVGVDWDNNGHWDIVLRYNDGSGVQKIVQNDITTGTDYLLVWKMDQVNDTIDMWINPTSASAAPNASYSDYQGSVAAIEGLTFWTRGMGTSGSNPAGVEIDDATLGDTMQDVIPEPATVGMMGFVTLCLLAFRRLLV